MQLGEAAGGRVQRRLFGLAGLVDEAVEEPLQNGVARGRRQCPVCELNGVRVSHAPVGVGFRIRVAFDSPYGVDGLSSSLRGCLQEPTPRGAVKAMRFARQFVGPFCNVGLLNPTGGMLERFRVNVPVLELSAWVLTRILRACCSALTMPPNHLHTMILKISTFSTGEKTLVKSSAKGDSSSLTRDKTPWSSQRKYAMGLLPSSGNVECVSQVSTKETILASVPFSRAVFHF